VTSYSFILYIHSVMFRLITAAIIRSLHKKERTEVDATSLQLKYMLIILLL